MVLAHISSLTSRPIPPTRGGGRSPNVEGRGGRNFNRRDITGNAAGWELGGAIFLKNASRCKFALQLLALRLLILPLSGQRKRLNTGRLNLSMRRLSGRRKPRRPPVPLPDKVINNRVFFPLNELERYQDGSQGW